MCGGEHVVEDVDHLGDAQVLDLCRTAAVKVAPEVAQKVAPRDLVVGDAIELLLQVGGEIEIDVARRRSFRGTTPTMAAAVLRHQPALVDADIFCGP